MLKVTETTSTPGGTIELAGTTFEIERITNEFNDGTTDTDTYLHGARGAVYLLRPYIERGGDTGIRQVISLKSGAPWRKKGNAVHVVEIAGMIEVIK